MTPDRLEGARPLNHVASRARILIISQFFGPDQSAVGQFLADFADEASRAGHEVRVICGANNYAADDVAARTGGLRDHSPAQRESDNSARPGALHVMRGRAAAFSQGKLKRVLSYATFYVGAVAKALNAPKPEVVVTLTAPPGLAWIGWLLQRIKGCHHVAWEMDLYPDIAIALGIPVASWSSWLLDFPRRRADTVIALGDCMKNRLLGHRLGPDRIFVAENWADGRIISPLPFPAPRPLCVLYSGNLGLAHDMATIRDVMQRLADHSDLHFVFAGGGLRRGDLLAFCRERKITNVSFRGYARQQELGASLAECHVGLVTQKPETLGAVVPSKIYGLMAAGRPALFIGPAAATPALLIRRFDCGWNFECGDVQGVSALLMHLLEHPDELERKGRNGRRAFLEHYDKPAGVARILRAMGLEIPGDC